MYRDLLPVQMLPRNASEPWMGYYVPRASLEVAQTLGAVDDEQLRDEVLRERVKVTRIGDPAGDDLFVDLEGGVVEERGCGDPSAA